MEESLAQGKTLNKEQQDVLRSKSSVLVLIDELEKLRAPIASALEEELSLSARETTPPPPPPQAEVVPSQAEEPSEIPPPAASDGGEAVKDLLNLMYFGSLFDVKPQSEFTSLMLTRTHERGCCLTYDYVTDDATDLLGERDLDLISALQGLMISRPVNSTLSHQNALEQCIEHAKRWLAKSDEPIDANNSVTYAGLREKLHKIMALDYFTATPQMKGPGEVAAAAAVGNFGSFQVPMHENVMPVEVPIQGEGSAGQYQETEENAVSYQEYETGENQSGAVEESHKGDLETGNPPEVVSAQTEQEQSQFDGEGYRNVDFKDQQYIHRRGQRGGRGGGGRRGGFPNGRGGRGTGRGGGPYQNGRNQYYDNYYPRNHYNRRGGRGGGGGGGNYYNQSTGQGNYNQANAGGEFES